MKKRFREGDNIWCNQEVNWTKGVKSDQAQVAPCVQEVEGVDYEDVPSHAGVVESTELSNPPAGC